MTMLIQGRDMEKKVLADVEDVTQKVSVDHRRVVKVGPRAVSAPMTYQCPWPELEVLPTLRPPLAVPVSKSSCLAHQIWWFKAAAIRSFTCASHATQASIMYVYSCSSRQGSMIDIDVIDVIQQARATCIGHGMSRDAVDA